MAYTAKAISGRGGEFTIMVSSTETIVGLCTNWRLTVQMDIDTFAAFGDGGWKKRMYLMSEWSGSASVKFNGADDAGQAAIMTSMGCDSTNSVPSECDIKLYTGNKSTNAKDIFSGKAYFRTLDISDSANGIVEADVAFEGDGILQYTATGSAPIP